MISKETLTIIKYIIRICSSLKTIPFFIDSKEGRIKTFTSTRDIIPWLLVAISFNWVLFGICGWQFLWKVILCRNGVKIIPPNLAITYCLNICSWFFASSLHLVLLLQRKDLEIFLNRFIDMDATLQSKRYIFKEEKIQFGIVGYNL